MKNIFVRTRTSEQLKAVLDWGRAAAVLADTGTWPQDSLSGYNGEIYICLPDVTRQSKIGSAEEMIQMARGRYGLVIKNLDQLEMVCEAGFTGPVIADSLLYACSSHAFLMYKEILPWLQFISCDELTDQEMRKTGCDVIYKAYGHQQLMVTSQCLMKNYSGCRQGYVRFKNERGDIFYSQTRCSQCYSVIYDGREISMLDRLDEIPFKNILADLTVEDAAQTGTVLALLELTGPGYKQDNRFTRGHHYRGVE